MRDTAVSRSLRLSSWPCWAKMTPEDAQLVQWTAANLLQPVIDQFGPITLTSWKWWYDSGCKKPRTGDHADAGTVDFVPQSSSIEDVWQWMGANLRGRWGSLINERDHIHVTRSGVGTAPGTDEFLREPVEGVYASAIPRLPMMALAGLLAGLIFTLRRRRK